MSTESGAAPVTVTKGGLRVEKSYVADEFPVPAIQFRIVSERDDPVELVLTDEIPRSFTMDAVGFHPEFEGDNWTAYKDHRVEFERTIDPGEEVLTVYGIRIEDDSEAEAFLVEPSVELVDDAAAEVDEDSDGVDELIGEDRNDVVRDALGGGAVPGLSNDEEETGEADEPPAPRGLNGDATPAVTPIEQGEDVGEDPSTDAEPDVEEPDVEEADAEPDVEEAHVEEADAEPDVEEAHVEAEPASTGAPAAGAVGAGGVAAALATEIRDGDVEDDDLETLREGLELELEATVPRSLEVRIERLQSKFEDLDAYSDALAEFIDDEGTGRDLIDEFRTEMDDIRDGMAGVREALAAADEDREGLRSDLETVEGQVDGTTERVGDLEDDIEGLDDRAAALADDLESLGGDLETVSDDLERAEADLSEDVEAVREDLSTQVDSTREELTEEVTSVRADLSEDVEAVREDLSTQVDSARTDLSEDVEAVREDLSTQVDSTRETLESDVHDLRSDLDDVEAELEELDAFRRRLSGALGAAATGGADEADADGDGE
jgi:predicted  nucleic acid-binding Zn-ribbon protein